MGPWPGFWPTQGDEKRLPSSNRSHKGAPPPLCHPACPGLPWDRSYPGFPGDVGGFDQLYAAFLRKPHTQPLVIRSRGKNPIWTSLAESSPARSAG
jgi:hypothetical protein